MNSYTRALRIVVVCDFLVYIKLMQHVTPSGQKQKPYYNQGICHPNFEKYPQRFCQIFQKDLEYHYGAGSIFHVSSESRVLGDF